jgi:undecaprenyl-diphosphatase
MEEWIKAIVLGMVEGLTEFLPISSTGHLLIVSQLLNFRESMGGTFEIFIQVGTVIAVIAFFAVDLLQQARTFPTDAGVRRLWLLVVLAFLPAAVAGFLLRDFIRVALFTSPAVIAWSLIVGGIVMVIVEMVPRGQPRAHELRDISWPQALGIGCAQVLALIPGVSRSGASIISGLLFGLDRSVATTFSFYLAIPTLGAATLYDLAKSLGSLNRSDAGYLLVGTVVAGITAAISIRWLLRYVAHHSFVAFGAYRIVAGALVLILLALHVL